MNMKMVLFSDGRAGLYEIRLYCGACLAGEPTAFVFRGEKLVWVVPGESVSFVEVKL